MRSIDGQALSEAGQEWDEFYRIESLLAGTFGCGFDDREVLQAVAMLAVLRERKHHPPSRLEVLLVSSHYRFRVNYMF